MPTPVSIVSLLRSLSPSSYALLAVDGPIIGGRAIAGELPVPLVYAPKQAGATALYPTGTYAATGLPGTVTRPYLSGHLPYNSFTPFNAGSYWKGALLDSVMSAWNHDGDWLMFVGVGDQGDNGTHGGYTIAECLIAPAPAPYTDAESAWFGWGGQPDNGSGTPFGLFGHSPTYDVKMANGGIVEGSANRIGMQLIHKLGNTVTVYSANSAGLTAMYSNGAYPTMGLPAYTNGSSFILERHEYGSVDMTDWERLLAAGIFSGTFQLSDLTAAAAAFTTGVPVFAPAPPAPPEPAGPLAWAPAACEGAQISIAWGASTFAAPTSGETYGYELRISPALTGGATTIDLAANVSHTVLSPAVIGTLYTITLYTYSQNADGVKRYSATHLTLKNKPCAPYVHPDYPDNWTEVCGSTDQTGWTMDCGSDS